MAYFQYPYPNFCGPPLFFYPPFQLQEQKIESMADIYPNNYSAMNLIVSSPHFAHSYQK